MILIAISGSTKCDWQLIDSAGKATAFSSTGINPFFHSEEEIIDVFNSIKEIAAVKDSIEIVYIYSAGCGSKRLKTVVRNALGQVFTRSHFYVNHDIVASALSTYEGVPAISCILGTGSNACFFDGDIVRQEIPALDYILSDEGGGSYYGKKLLTAYLHNTMPQELREKFSSQYALSQEEILEKVYMQPYANVYLASFMPFIQDNIKDEYLYTMVKEGMGLFMDLFVRSFSRFNNVKTHFTGSIAYYFKDILNEVASAKKITVGKIIKEPINDLVKYHLDKSPPQGSSQ
ncbi:hypothetical protein FNH22_28360 [Fulvivirga sp. M361]|uniref:hypothetical protein n=1 Tax=Fulvivirga sp. M361 TaxID=2594266 RepID=UPI00117ACE15|nr:hypothetical protein [Fulvivirga sp. M361]TRX48802.1 hypothetical protein FNH22_28360 [Fulvivirga sp. M361]